MSIKDDVNEETVDTTVEETVKEEKAPEEECDKKKKGHKCEKLEAEIAALKAEIKEKDDKYLRMAAEYDNFRRRSREEKQASYDGAMADTVAELLPIIDNLERAALYGEEAKVKEGIVMTAKAIEASLKALGVEEIGKVGEKFDPKFHNAVMHIDDEQYGENEIVEVFQKGYKKGSRIIRFAMVKTAN